MNASRVAVVLTERALSDLEELVAWYTEQGRPETGARTVAEILSRLEPLADLPDLGRVVPEFSHPLLRELVRPPFRIVYRREPEAVRILRVWRSERPLRLPPDEQEPSGPDQPKTRPQIVNRVKDT